MIVQRALDPDCLAANRSILALLFRLELSEMPDAVTNILALLATWLSEDAQAPLLRDVRLWVEQLLSREFKGEPVFDALKAEEANIMRGRKFETWADAFEDCGLQRGLEQALGRECATLQAILKRLLARRRQCTGRRRSTHRTSAGRDIDRMDQPGHGRR